MRIGIASAFVLALAGCATVPSAPPVMKATGPYRPHGMTGGLVDRFMTSAKAADVTSPNQPQLDAMLNDGFSLVYAHCNDFFRDSGEKQTRLLVIGDIVTTFGTLASSALAIGNRDGNKAADTLALVTLGTSSAMAGLDIYTQRYLFGAENVDAVRELTLNALVAHADKARSLHPATYQAVSQHLLDNQALCTPRRISMLAREAIQTGDIIPSTIGSAGSDALAQLGQDLDRKVLKDLGTVLNPPGAVSAAQAGALYWLLYSAASDTERTTVIRQMLKDLPDAGNPFDASGKLKDPIPHQAAIQSALMSLRPATRMAFEEQIKDARANALAGGAGGPSPGDLFDLAPEAPPVEGSRVSIKVQ